MCKQAACSKCGTVTFVLDGVSSLTSLSGKRSWWGCGNHIPSIMDTVPEPDRCNCEPKVEVDGSKYPPKAAKADWMMMVNFISSSRSSIGNSFWIPINPCFVCWQSKMPLTLCRSLWWLAVASLTIQRILCKMTMVNYHKSSNLRSSISWPTLWFKKRQSTYKFWFIIYTN